LILDFVTFSCLLLVEESTTMLESESRYLPVLSEPSSGPSSPLIHRSSPLVHCSSPLIHRADVGLKLAAANTVKPRRIVANFAGQVALQCSDVVIQPTKSTSDPTSHGTSVGRHSQSPVARTLHLDSSDASEAAVTDAVDTACSRRAELCRQSDVKRKACHQSGNDSSLVALSSAYTLDICRDTMRQICGGDSQQTHTKHLSGSSSDTKDCTASRSHVVSDGNSLVRAADTVDRNRPDLQGKSTCSF